MRKLLVFILFCVILLIGCSSEKSDFSKAKKDNSIKGYETFLQKHPEGDFKEQVEQRLQELAYQSARQKNSLKIYKEFLKKFPGSKYFDEIKLIIEQLSKEVKLLSYPGDIHIYAAKMDEIRSECLFDIQNKKFFKGKTPLSVSLEPGKYYVGFYKEGDELDDKQIDRSGVEVSGLAQLSSISDGLIVYQGRTLGYQTRPGKKGVSFIVSAGMGEHWDTLEYSLLRDGFNSAFAIVQKGKVKGILRIYELVKLPDKQGIVTSAFLTKKAVLAGDIPKSETLKQNFPIDKENMEKQLVKFGIKQNRKDTILSSLRHFGIAILTDFDARTFNDSVQDPLQISSKGKYVGIVRIGDQEDPESLTYELQLLNEEAKRYSAKVSTVNLYGQWFADPISAVRFIPGNSELLCATANNEVWHCDILNKKVLSIVTGFEKDIRLIIPAGRYWILGLENNSLHVWDTKSREEVFVVDIISAKTGFDVDLLRQRVFYVTGNNELTIFSLKENKPIMKSSLKDKISFQGIFYDATTDHLLLLSKKGEIQIYSGTNLKLIKKGEQRIKGFSWKYEYSNPNLAGQVQPDHCLLWCDQTPSIYRVNLKTGAYSMVTRFSTTLGEVYFSNDNSITMGLKDKRIDLIGLKSKGYKKSTRLSVNGKAAGFSLDNNKLVIGCEDHTLRFFSIPALQSIEVIGIPLKKNSVRDVSKELTIKRGTKMIFRKAVPSKRKIIAYSVGCSMGFDEAPGITIRFVEFEWDNARLWYKFMVYAGASAPADEKIKVHYNFNVNASKSFKVSGVDEFNVHLK